MSRERHGQPRIILIILAIASGLLFLGICAEWIRGYWSATDIQWIPASKAAAATVGWGDGTVVFTFIACQPDDDPKIPSGWSIEKLPVPGSSDALRRFWQSIGPHVSFAGFAYGATFDPGFSEHAFQMPFWPLLVLTLILPTVAVRRIWKARRRRLAGLCRCCGYDLRASEGACPECGTAIVRPSSTVGVG